MIVDIYGMNILQPQYPIYEPMEIHLNDLYRTKPNHYNIANHSFVEPTESLPLWKTGYITDKDFLSSQLQFKRHEWLFRCIAFVGCFNNNLLGRQ